MPNDIKVATLAGLLAQADMSAADFIAAQSLEKSAEHPERCAAVDAYSPHAAANRSGQP